MKTAGVEEEEGEVPYQLHLIARGGSSTVPLMRAGARVEERLEHLHLVREGERAWRQSI